MLGDGDAVRPVHPHSRYAADATADRDCDVNEVYDEINRRLGDRGTIQGYWQGPTETALYLYGHSAEEMRDLISGYMAEYPLCQRARVVRIA